MKLKKSAGSSEIWFSCSNLEKVQYQFLSVGRYNGEVLWFSYSRSRLSSPVNTLPLTVVSGVRWIDLQNIDYNLGAYITKYVLVLTAV